PSEFGITTGSPPSMTATQLLVVPRSMPITLGMKRHSLAQFYLNRLAVSGQRGMPLDEAGAAQVHGEIQVAGGSPPPEPEGGRAQEPLVGVLEALAGVAGALERFLELRREQLDLLPQDGRIGRRLEGDFLLDAFHFVDGCVGRDLGVVGHGARTIAQWREVP